MVHQALLSFSIWKFIGSPCLYKCTIIEARVRVKAHLNLQLLEFTQDEMQSAVIGSYQLQQIISELLVRDLRVIINSFLQLEHQKTSLLLSYYNPQYCIDTTQARHCIDWRAHEFLPIVLDQLPANFLSIKMSVRMIETVQFIQIRAKLRCW